MKNTLIVLMVALAMLVAGCTQQGVMTEKKDGAMLEGSDADQMHDTATGQEWTPEQIAEMQKEEAMKAPPQPGQQPATAPSTRYSPEHSLTPNAPSSGVQRTVGGYVGTVLAGSYSPLLDYNKQDYTNAIIAGKVVVLYFYADWCPVCKAEFPVMQDVFNGLTTDKVVGFRVHFKDSAVDADSTNLAKQFQVPYQHTKVILVSGKQVLKSPEGWDKARYESEIAKVVG